jgi:short/branched chain acyl-CoA dehydrogenase
MDFELTQEQGKFRDTVRQFAEKEVRPISEELDAKGEFHYALIPRMAELGVFGLIFPEKYGGSAVDTITYSLVLEELARVDSSVAATVAGQVNLSGDLIYRLGTEAQREKWLVPLIKGEALGAFGLTEPSAGSDAGGIRTRAERVGDHWVINGNKCFISNVGTRMKEIVVVAAATGTGERGKKLISVLVVESGTPGFRTGKQYRKLGWRSSATAELIFEDCRIPKENLLGVEGQGFKQFLETLNLGRIAIASLGVGVAQGCLELALAHAKQREQFGQPISKFQAIQFKLADMALKVELARLITHKAATLRDQGKPFAMEAAMAKLYGSEIATQVSHQAIQIHGGSGFMDDCPVSRFYRDARVLEIGEGTSEVQRLVIARNLGC